MNVVKVKRLLKLIYSIFIIYIFLNIFFVTESFGSIKTLNPVNGFFATIFKVIIVFSQVAVSGFFIIRFTVHGIEYFCNSTPKGKEASKHGMQWTLIYGVITLVAMSLFSKIMGL